MPKTRKAATDVVTDTTEPDDDGSKGAPHRPSRRHVIILAAVRVFASKGFIDASIQDIADEAGVVPTAVYYHFEGKEELFDACIERCWESLDKATAQARPDDEEPDPYVFTRVLQAAWAWVERYPDAATLLYLHMPGATQRSRRLHQAQLERHTHRAFDYIDSTKPPRTRRQAATLHAQHSLSVRTLISLVIGIHPMRMHDGPLSHLPAEDVRTALEATSTRLLAM